MSAPAVWAYIRVFCNEGADCHLPGAGQRRAIEDDARQHYLRLAPVFVDEARWGGTDQREEFKLSASMAAVPCST